VLLLLSLASSDPPELTTAREWREREREPRRRPPKLGVGVVVQVRLESPAAGNGVKKGKQLYYPHAAGEAGPFAPTRWHGTAAAKVKLHSGAR
jgi:hypothetical protein